MDNFTAFVLESAASDPTRPLTAARKALVEKCLLEFFPDSHTPNHPTYAAMIHRAIMELKEKEDSTTEESITEFIRKEYHDLPWAHITLLKHHLQMLCQSGEIFVTSDNCYLLSDGITNLISYPCSSPKRELKQQMRKRQGKKSRGRARRYREDQFEEKNQSKGKLKVIQGQNQHNLPEEPDNELFEKLKMMQGGEEEQRRILVEEQNQLEGQILDLENLEQNQPEVSSPEKPPCLHLVIYKELPFSEMEHRQPELPNKESSPDLKQALVQESTPTTEQQVNPYGLLIGEQNQLEPKNMDSEHLEQIQTEVPRPERPPDFNLVIGKELCSSEVQNQEPEVPNEDRPPELKQTPVEESVQATEQQLKQHGQRKWTESQPKTEKYSINKPGVPKQSKRKQPPVLPSPERVCTLHHREPELPNEDRPQELAEETILATEQQAKQHGRRTRMKSQPKTVTDSSSMPVVPKQSKRKQLPELPSPERAHSLRHNETHNSSQCRQLRPRPPKFEQATAITTVELLALLPQQQQHEERLQLPNMGTMQELEHTPAEGLTEQEQQPPKLSGQPKLLKSKLKTRAGSLRLRLNLQQEPKQLPVSPIPERVEEEQDQLAQENPTHRQLRPRRPKNEAAVTNVVELVPVQDQHEKQKLLHHQDQGRPLKSEQATISTSMELLPQQQRHEEHLQLPSMGTMQELEQTPAESLTEQEQQPQKLRGQPNVLKSKLKRRAGSLCLCLNLQQEPKQLPVSPITEKVEEQQDQLAQENPTHRQLRPRHPKNEAAVTSVAELVRVQDQHEKQKQLHCQDQGTPLKSEQATATTSVELLPPQQHHEEHLQLPNMGMKQELEQTPAEDSTEQEQQRPKLRGRPKLLKSKLKTRSDSLRLRLTLEQEPKQLPVFPSPERVEEQQDQLGQENSTHRQLRPRSSKNESAATSVAELMSVQDQHKKQKLLHHQDQEGPLELKSDTTSTAIESSTSDHQNKPEQQQPALRDRGRPCKYPYNPQQQTKCRGCGRPPKAKPDGTTMENVFPSEKLPQEPKCRGQGRPRKSNERN